MTALSASVSSAGVSEWKFLGTGLLPAHLMTNSLCFVLSMEAVAEPLEI
jgi:hypothetical protein